MARNAFENTFVFFLRATLFARGGETCLAELSTGVTVTGFLILLLGWSGPISGKRSVSGGVSSSMRRFQLRHGKLRGGTRKGEKKRRGKKGKREGLDKNRRERNKEWEINRGRREDARVYFIIEARGGNGKELVFGAENGESLKRWKGRRVRRACGI